MALRHMTIIAIIPAAGRSGRMGTPKQLLPVNGNTMLAGVASAALGGGVARVVVVTNEMLRDRLTDLPPTVTLAVNDDPRTSMIDSIRIGLSLATNADGYLICPADAAGVVAADVRRCVEAFATNPDRIIVATHAGRRGHPMIFPAALAEAVRSSECDDGLNRLARNRPSSVREVPCDSPGTIANVNTPADYQKLDSQE
jgi:molybdenum cofactor cytidylyltransferase